MESDNNFVLELSTSMEEQVISFQHICSAIYSRNEFVDCTLCCSDGQLQAHRVILASASTYMHTMLSGTPWPTPCSHPMLFFKTFSLSDMKLALEFIYTGKAKVSRNKLPTLMNIARELGCGSLSKAIEKAIYSCGVEIFRNRIQVHPTPPPAVNKSVPSSSSALPASTYLKSRALVYSQYQNQTTINSNNRHSEQHIRESSPIVSQNESSDVTHSSGGNPSKDEETFFPNEVKVEPGENMMLELDPTSIATSMDSTTFENENQPSSTFASVEDVNNGKIQDGNVKLDQNLNTELETKDENFELNNEDIDSLIGIKDKSSNKDDVQHAENMNHGGHENVIDVEDDEQGQDEDEEEMPITVVDLKSLAETGIETDADDAVMPSTISDNPESLPANCPWCFQVFTSLTLLQRHIKTHVGVYKPYSCQYCPASFARTAHLKRHIRTHTGEKPFVCTYCSRAFSRQDKLKTHLEKHLLDQHMQNAKLNNQTNMNLILPKPTTSIPSTTSSGFSPHKQQLIPGISTSTNFSQVLPSPASSYQYFINDGTDIWQSQADRISKGLIGVPGQITISTAISPSTTITPIPSLMVHQNPPTSHI